MIESSNKNLCQQSSSCDLWCTKKDDVGGFSDEVRDVLTCIPPQGFFMKLCGMVDKDGKPTYEQNPLSLLTSQREGLNSLQKW